MKKRSRFYKRTRRDVDICDDEDVLKKALTLRVYQMCIDIKYIKIVGYFCIICYALKYNKPYDKWEEQLRELISFIRKMRIKGGGDKRRAIKQEICEYCEWDNMEVTLDFAEIPFDCPIEYEDEYKPVLEKEFCQKFLDSLDCLINCLAERISIDEFFRICFSK